MGPKGTQVDPLVRDLRLLRGGSGLSLSRLARAESLLALPAVIEVARDEDCSAATAAYRVLLNSLSALGGTRESLALRNALALTYDETEQTLRRAEGNPSTLTQRRIQFGAEHDGIAPDTVESWENRAIDEVVQLLRAESQASGLAARSPDRDEASALWKPFVRDCGELRGLMFLFTTALNGATGPRFDDTVTVVGGVRVNTRGRPPGREERAAQALYRYARFLVGLRRLDIEWPTNTEATLGSDLRLIVIIATAGPTELPFSDLDRSALRSAMLASPHEELVEFLDALALRGDSLFMRWQEWLNQCPGETCLGTCPAHRSVVQAVELHDFLARSYRFLARKAGEGPSPEPWAMTYNPERNELRFAPHVDLQDPAKPPLPLR